MKSNMHCLSSHGSFLDFTILTISLRGDLYKSLYPNCTSLFYPFHAGIFSSALLYDDDNVGGDDDNIIIIAGSHASSCNLIVTVDLNACHFLLRSPH